MNKSKRSWLLFKRSMSVIGSNKKLLVFPIAGSMLTCAIAVVFIAPIALWDTGHSYGSADHWKVLGSGFFIVHEEHESVGLAPTGYLLVAMVYLVSMFFATFFNVVFFNEILNALNGKKVSIRRGFTFAMSRLKAILAWSILTGVVGMIIKALEDHFSLFGRWIIKLIGMTWSAASIFAIPVIIRDEANTNPVRFLRTSANILKKNWGESLIGFLGVKVGSLLIVLGSFMVLGLSIYLSLNQVDYWIVATIFVAWMVALLIFSYILSVVSKIYLGALYIYAAEGVLPEPYNEEMMNMAWKVTSGRKASRE